MGDLEDLILILTRGHVVEQAVEEGDLEAAAGLAEFAGEEGLGGLAADVREHIKEAAYLRNGVPDRSSYTISDGLMANRFTLASLVQTSSVVFNRFQDFCKFTNIFYGGFDGVNILDESQAFFMDRSMSSDTGGEAIDGDPDLGLVQVGSQNQAGTGRLKNNQASQRTAVENTSRRGPPASVAPDAQSTSIFKDSSGRIIIKK